MAGEGAESAKDAAAGSADPVSNLANRSWTDRGARLPEAAATVRFTNQPPAANRTARRGRSGLSTGPKVPRMVIWPRARGTTWRNP